MTPSVTVLVAESAMEIVIPPMGRCGTRPGSLTGQLDNMVTASRKCAFAVEDVVLVVYIST